MDEADMANDYQEKWLAAQLDEHKYQLNQVGDVWPYGIGKCKNCGDSTGEERRPYCSEGCRDDHWDRIKADKRNGKYRGG